MKKLTIYITACLIIPILFSSCSSYFTISKRHYSKGYYIDYSRNKQYVFTTKEKTRTRIISPAYPIQAPSDNSIKVVSSPKALEIANPATTSKSEKKQNKVIFHRNNKEVQVQRNSLATNEIPDAQVKQAVTLLSSVTDEDHPSRRDVLSLFWIVILIVLLLWLIGILTGSFGIGAFINLLLLVALVLLILWLLRII